MTTLTYKETDIDVKQVLLDRHLPARRRSSKSGTDLPLTIQGEIQREVRHAIRLWNNRRVPMIAPHGIVPNPQILSNRPILQNPPNPWLPLNPSIFAEPPRSPSPRSFSISQPPQSLIPQNPIGRSGD